MNAARDDPKLHPSMTPEHRAQLEAELREEQACLWVYEYVIQPGTAPPRAVRAAGRIREIEAELRRADRQQ